MESVIQDIIASKKLICVQRQVSLLFHNPFFLEFLPTRSSLCFYIKFHAGSVQG